MQQPSVRFGYTGFEAAPLRADSNLNKVTFHFDRTQLAIVPDAVVTLYLTGRMADGTLFVGSDTVRIPRY